MFRNYLAATLRNLVRSKFTATLNALGLAVGFAAALLAGLYLRDELTFDRWVPAHERIYDVASTRPLFRGAAPRDIGDTYSAVAASLRLDYPEVEAAARLARIRELRLRRGEMRAVESTFAWADPDFFAVLQIPAVAGDLKTALASPEGAVLTRSLARKYFGRDAPIGEEFEINGATSMRVMAVIEDWPSNSTFGALQGFLSARAPTSFFAVTDARQYGRDLELFAFPVAPTYFRLRPGAEIATLERDAPAFVARHIDPSLFGDVRLRYRPLASIHLDPASRNFIAASGGPGAQAVMLAVGVIGLLILAVAAVNFVNLTTARLLPRAVEVAVRKTAGAARRDLIIQFIGEAFLHVALAMGLAVAAVSLIMPSYNAFLGRAIVLDVLRSPLLLGGMAGLVALIALLAGAYPALVLSRFLPAVVLKAAPAKTSGPRTARQLIVVAQFAVLVGLILAAIVVERQTKFAMDESLRFDKEEVVILDRGCTPALKAEVGALAGVRAVACSWSNTTGVMASPGYGNLLSINGRTNLEIGITPLDFGFFELYGLAPVAGRFFSEDFGADIADAAGATNPSVVINESAVRHLGFASPAEAVGRTIDWRRMLPARGAPDRRPALPSQIVGVVPDFSPLAARAAAAPVIYYADMSMSMPYPPAGAQSLNIKLNAGGVARTLDAIDAVWARLGDPDRPVNRRFVDEVLQVIYLDVIRQERLVAVFSAVAVIVAILGLFSFSALTAERRTKEIGIRKSMGAARNDILRLMLWQFTKPVLWANIVAWPAAYLLMRRWLEGFAAHIDLAPWMFLAASAIALAIAILTVIGHALLVARAEPVKALRYE